MGLFFVRRPTDPMNARNSVLVASRYGVMLNKRALAYRIQATALSRIAGHIANRDEGKPCHRLAT